MLPEDKYKQIAKADYGEGFIVILYKTDQNQYFSTVRTIYGRTEGIQNLTRERAVETYNKRPVHLISFEVAFPVLEVEDA